MSGPARSIAGKYITHAEDDDCASEVSLTVDDGAEMHSDGCEYVAAMDGLEAAIEAHAAAQVQVALEPWAFAVREFLGCPQPIGQVCVQWR